MRGTEYLSEREEVEEEGVVEEEGGEEGLEEVDAEENGALFSFSFSK
jgi:hypothetical protein